MGRCMNRGVTRFRNMLLLGLSAMVILTITLTRSRVADRGHSSQCPDEASCPGGAGKAARNVEMSIPGRPPLASPTLQEHVAADQTEVRNKIRTEFDPVIPPTEGRFSVVVSFVAPSGPEDLPPGFQLFVFDECGGRIRYVGPEHRQAMRRCKIAFDQPGRLILLAIPSAAKNGKRYQISWTRLLVTETVSDYIATMVWDLGATVVGHLQRADGSPVKGARVRTTEPLGFASKPPVPLGSGEPALFLPAVLSVAGSSVAKRPPTETSSSLDVASGILWTCRGEVSLAATTDSEGRFEIHCLRPSLGYLVSITSTQESGTFQSMEVSMITGASLQTITVR